MVRSSVGLTGVLVVQHITDGYEIIDRVFDFVLVMLLVVELKHLSWIIRREHGAIPAAYDAFEPVALQYSDSNRVGNRPIMLVRLAIFFQNIYADCQVFATAVLGDDGPALLRPQFADAASPFLLVLREV